MAAVTIGLLVTSIVLAWSTIVTSRRAQRAYLSVEPQGIETLKPEDETLAQIGICNTGHLPARNVVWTGHIAAPYAGERRDFEITWEKKSGSFIVPGGTVVPFGTVRIRATDIDRDKGKNQYCYVWGEVRYHDGFHEPRHTKFCHRYPINMRTQKGDIGKQYARFHDYGNEADGSAVWKRVLSAIKEIRREEPREGEAVN